MTSKTSWFNRGIFTSNLRRFAWGGVLYTVLIFLMTVLPILFIVNPGTHWILNSHHRSLLLTDTYIYLPVMMALVVPSIVALLTYRFVHSKKTSIFIHALPVARKGIFVSSALSAFVLMAVPVLVNGVLLILLSVCGYGILFSVKSCFAWMAVNLLTQVLMFSVATFACFLTGNTFAAVVLNGMIHLVAIASAASFSSLSQVFLYGFYNQNEVLNATLEWNFVSYAMSFCSNFPYTDFAWGKLMLMLLFAGALYLAAWLLYRKRRLETAEDVAGYRVLNPIFKYTAAFLAALGTFAITCYSLAESKVFCVVIVSVIGAVVYFAAEMILKKTLKVRGAWKGLLALGAVFVVMSSVFTFTTFFGYETRVPDAEDVESVAIYDYRNGITERFVTDPEVITRAVAAHSELVRKENVYRLKQFLPERSFNLELRYALKNGKMLIRSYPVSENFFFSVMGDLYTSQEYKQKNVELFAADIGRIYGVELPGGYRLTEDEAEDFLICLRADLREVTYADVHTHEAWNANIYVEYVPSEGIGLVNENHEIRGMHQNINASFTKTVAWLLAHGHLTSIVTGWKQDLVLLNETQWNEYNGAEKEIVEYAANSVEVKARERMKITDIEGVRYISEAQKTNAYTFMVTTPFPYEPGREYAYRLCRVDEQGYLFNVAAFYDTPEVKPLFNYVQ